MGGNGFDCGEGLQLWGCPWGMELCPVSYFSQHLKGVSALERVAEAQLGHSKGWLWPNCFPLCAGGLFGSAVLSPGLLRPC